MRDWTEVTKSLDIFLTEGRGKRRPRIGSAGSPEKLEPILIDYDRTMHFWLTVDKDGTCGKCNPIVEERLKKAGLIFRPGVTTLDDIRFVSKGWCDVSKRMITHAEETGGALATTMYSRGLQSDVMVWITPNPNTLVQHSGDYVITWLAIGVYNEMLAKTGWHRKHLSLLPDSFII